MKALIVFMAFCSLATAWVCPKTSAIQKEWVKESAFGKPLLHNSRLSWIILQRPRRKNGVSAALGVRNFLETVQVVKYGDFHLNQITFYTFFEGTDTSHRNR